ncbi:hypothetical protein PROSTU_01263 [Providencia stuartii ATCC 25827]|uniref:Uncharacterized protein n=1 Tax=Providencia stuartii ATCC 25827 TaxID=471874 RepID=A0AA86YYU7_PROST|nr:hypothetical protein PROSTU_01263 [Providencia stuartii ATCC 25827]
MIITAILLFCFSPKIACFRANLSKWKCSVPFYTYFHFSISTLFTAAISPFQFYHYIANNLNFKRFNK